MEEEREGSEQEDLQEVNEGKEESNEQEKKTDKLISSYSYEVFQEGVVHLINFLSSEEQQTLLKAIHQISQNYTPTRARYSVCFSTFISHLKFEEIQIPIFKKLVRLIARKIINLSRIVSKNIHLKLSKNLTNGVRSFLTHFNPII